MIWFGLFGLLGCGGPSPEPMTAAPLQRGEALALAVRRASHSEQRACEAVHDALNLAPSWSTDDGPLPLGLRDAGARGFEPDWAELALAVGPGPLSAALVTAGGVLSGDAACADPARLSRWLTRGPTLTQAPDCVRDALLAHTAAAVQSVIERPCLCADAAPADAEQLAKHLDAIGLDSPAERARAWPSQPGWTPCEPAP